MNRKKYIICLLMSMYCFFISIVISNIEHGKTFTITSKPIYWFLIFLFIILLFSIIILLLLKKFSPATFNKIMDLFFEEEEEVFDGDKYIDELRNKIVDSSKIIRNAQKSSSTDILELMLDNMKEIRDYYIISKQQAKNSFYLAVSLCIFGFLLISTSILFSVAFDFSLSISLIPAIGGTIAEVIAGTTLIVYKTSLSQLNNYYNSLHNNERFLSLVNLVSKVSESKRDEAYLNIINIELENYRK